MFTTFEGDNTVLLQLAAKNLLTDYKDAFGELDPLGMAQFVAGQALGTIAERTAVRKARSPGRTTLLDRDEQLDLFRWRQEHLLAGAARRLKRGIDAGRDPVSRARRLPGPRGRGGAGVVDLVVLEAFADVVRRCPTGAPAGARPAVSLLRARADRG